jgi:hypothetical protein
MIWMKSHSFFFEILALSNLNIRFTNVESLDEEVRSLPLGCLPAPPDAPIFKLHDR